MILPPFSVIEKIKETNGALSICEAIAIMNLAAESPKGKYIELGVFNGKSAMAASFGLQPGMFILVDPMFEDEKVGDLVIENVHAVNAKMSLSIFAGLSFDAIPQFPRYSYVMVDSGSHQDGIPMKEVRMFEHLVVPKGVVVFHDFNSQFKEVREAYEYLLSTGGYEAIEIDWSEIINYVSKHDLEKGNNSWHHAELEFPCFVGALRKK